MRTQYRLTIWDRVEILDAMPDWSAIVRAAEERGIPVKLESRFIEKSPDPVWVEGFRDLETGNLPIGFMLFNHQLISSWSYKAAVNWLSL